MNSLIRVGYSLPSEELPTSFSNRDPLRFSFIAERLAELIVPDITNQIHRSAYFKLIALAGNKVIRNNLSKYSKNHVDQILLLERAWTIGLFIAEQITSDDKGMMIYGVNRAKNLANDIDFWKVNHLLDKSAILTNQLGTGGYGYYHRSFESLGLGYDKKPKPEFVKKITKRQRNLEKKLEKIATSIMTNIKKPKKKIGQNEREEIKNALLQLVQLVPLVSDHENEGDVYIRNILLGNPERKKVFKIRQQNKKYNEYDLIYELRKTDSDQGKACLATVHLEHFAKKCIEGFKSILESTIEKNKNIEIPKNIQHNAKQIYQSLNSIDQLPSSNDPFTKFLIDLIENENNLPQKIVLYHESAQIAKHRKPWVYWNKSEEQPERFVSESTLLKWTQELSIKKPRGFIHKYRTDALMDIIHNTQRR